MDSRAALEQELAELRAYLESDRLRLRENGFDLQLRKVCCHWQEMIRQVEHQLDALEPECPGN